MRSDISPGSSVKLPVSEIVVGKRFRKDVGDLEELARSIAEVGLLHPIVVDSNKNLIAGSRRLQALKNRGWSEIPAFVVDLTDAAVGEIEENTVRKGFTLSEVAEIARAKFDKEKEAAKERMIAPLRSNSSKENVSERKKRRVVHMTSLERCAELVVQLSKKHSRY